MIWPDIITNKIYYYLWKLKVINVNREYTSNYILYEDSSAYDIDYIQLKDSILYIKAKTLVNWRQLPATHSRSIYIINNVQYINVQLPKNY